MTNVQAERSPHDEWIELGYSQEPSAISEKLGSGCSGIFPASGSNSGRTALLEM